MAEKSRRLKSHAVVVGQGSIGKRHAHLLNSEGFRVVTVSQHDLSSYRSLSEIEFLGASALVVVANETSRHHSTLVELKHCGYRGKVLIEKPIFSQVCSISEFSNFQKIGVGYNLRFHPVIEELRKEIKGQEIVSVRMHVGQYLPDWRPNRNYRTGYSASREMGGGVLRDLSHEIDLMQYLFGRWSRLVSARPGNSVLNLESDECWSIIVQMDSGALVNMTLNYHDRPAERRYVVTTQSETIVADLVKATLSNSLENRQFSVDRNSTYLLQYEHMMTNGVSTICTLEEGLAVVQTIEMIERSEKTESWQTNE